MATRHNKNKVKQQDEAVRCNNKVKDQRKTRHNNKAK
jgi:hypothetical protein